MRLIDRVIVKELIGPFLNGMFMFLMLLFAATYLFPMSEFLVKGVPLWDVLRLVFYSAPSLLTQTFPMAMLLAALLGMGQLSANREIVAIFAAGISFPRAARAVIVMGALVSVAAFVWNDTVVPPSSAVFQKIKQEVARHLIHSDEPLSYNVESKDKKGIDEFVKADGGIDARTRTLRRVTIVKFSTDPRRRGEPEVVVTCDHAQAVDQIGLNWTYFKGFITMYLPDKATGRIENVRVIDFDEFKTLPNHATIGKTFEEVLNTQSDDPNSKSFRQLRHEINADRAKGEISDARGKEVDLYGKIALPLASLIFGVVGAALGVSTKRGGGNAVGFGMAIFIVFLYWVFYHAMFVVGKNGGLPPMLASFSADIVGAVAGIALAMRASQ